MYNDHLKTVGILGGYGPYATAHFFKTIIDYTPAEKDWEHLHVIIDNNPRIPSRVRAYLFDEEDPLPYMVEGIERLKKSGSDFFVCPCNSAHYFLRKTKDLPLFLLDMVDLVIEEISRNKYNKVGIIGSELTIGCKLYENPLVAKGFDVINVQDLSEVRQIIEDVKQGKDLTKAKKLMLKITDYFLAQGAEAVIYACTELPLVLSQKESLLPIVDTTETLAKGAIKYSKITS